MINKSMHNYGVEPSAIRALFAYGCQRKAEIGEDKVFDLSIGNPSIPTPKRVVEALKQCVDSNDDIIHAYTPAPGAQNVREAVAKSISKRFGVSAFADSVYMTSGAAAAIAISIAAITNPGDEVILIAPYFPEYRVWVNGFGCKVVEVNASQPDFQIDVAAVKRAITSKTSAIIINTPNNPTGAVYSKEKLEELSIALQEKEAEFNRKIYLICDEPYREIVYGAEVAFVPSIYSRTIVCYSYSKTFSLPGERIGYIYVSDFADDTRDVLNAICGAGRALGFVCAPSLFQQVIAKCVDVTANIEQYKTNRDILTKGLSNLGYKFVRPDGAFYLWGQSLEKDAKTFSEKAKDHELLLVPSDSFGCSGWFRASYCVSQKTIENSLQAFAALMADYR